VYQGASGALSFDNAGSVTSAGGRNAAPTVRLDGSGLASATIANSGTITGGGLLATLSFDGAAGTGAAPTGSFVNSGTISGAYGVTLASSVTNNTVVNSSETGPADIAPLSLSVTNSGTIEATAFAGSALVSQISGPAALTITNSGTIRASGAGFVSYELLDWYTCFYTPGPCQYVASAEPALAIGSISDSLTPGNAVTTSITNTASGVIEATGSVSTAIRSDNPLTLVNSGTITGTDFTVEPFDGDAGPEGTIRFAGAIQTFGTGNDSITNSGTINGSIDLAGGNDIVVNTGTINGNVMLGDGDDRFVERLSAVVTGTVDGGAGANTLTIDLTGGGTLNASYFDTFTHFGTVALTGSGSIAASGVLPVQTLFLDAGSTFELQAGSTLQTLGATALTGTDGADHVINRGTIVGDVALGGGDDLFEVYGAASVRGHVDGGAGSDRLVFHLDDAAGRTAMDVRPYTGFEQLALESGTGTLSGDVGFDTISINGGRLIGLAGSTISAPGGITVARGATFGSAGTVNGAILVNGTLSPGASPGTMRVNGNVTLASGSTTYFEMTPTVSDALVITGNLAIASGTTLQIVGERPLTPGIRYHLITATDGITGSFATIDKVATVQGFIMQTADSIDLLGTLQLHAGASRAVTATTTYLNDLLITGAASDQLLAAMPQLTSADGYVNAAAVATLHPEAYAAASQIGIDNGLAISSALRSTQRAGEGAHRGLFTLGQGLGGWQTMRGNAAAGTANARDNTGGFLGGIGYQAGKLAFAAFAGRLYANQTLPTRAASTRANGTFVGGMVSFANRGLDLGGSVTWDDSSATTRRTLFDASTVTGDYALHTLTLDAHGGYGFALGRGGWRIGPELGVTHIRVKRGEARETGGSLFALDVAGRRQQATFLSADVRLDMAASARLRPWLTAGWRRRLGGNAMLATASLSGVAAQFTVEGARRDRDYAQIGGGFDWTATPGVILFARGSSAVTNAYGTTNVTGGIRLGF
jgi:outer membrane autotransporter protein